MLKHLPEKTLDLRLAFTCLVVIAAFGFAMGNQFVDDQKQSAVQHSAPTINVDTQTLQRVVLQSHQGVATNWGSYAGSMRVVFFGYTFCPDICPMGLANVAGALDILDARGVALTPIFVTVDPDRDTPEVLNEYVGYFHDRLEGLTGKDNQIKTLASAFLAYYEISSQTQDDEYYLIDHTSYIYLIGEDGSLLGYYPESSRPDQLSDAILTDLNANKVY